MSQIDQLFAKLRGAKQKAFMPFVTAGDPDLSFTAELLGELARRGSHLCELGIPYSDPIADGPVIQASYTRALAGRVKLPQILEMLSGVAPRITAPVVTMVSYAIIYRHGLEKYVVAAIGVADAAAVFPVAVLGPDAGVVQARGDRVHVAGLAVVILHHVAETAVQHARLAE